MPDTTSCDVVILYTSGPGMCGGVITDEPGMISSVDSDSDGQYDLDRDCLWTLVADETRFIKFHVLTFDLELSYTCELDMLHV